MNPSGEAAAVVLLNGPGVPVICLLNICVYAQASAAGNFGQRSFFLWKWKMVLSISDRQVLISIGHLYCPFQGTRDMAEEGLESKYDA